ncbi:hypothetical protein N0V90_006262 [Kalmusia sp. IMI 367209]|nr:hypothetical protein N0V90_006262 [Kalmusia sp. IMI 367209]
MAKLTQSRGVGPQTQKASKKHELTSIELTGLAAVLLLLPLLIQALWPTQLGRFLPNRLQTKLSSVQNDKDVALDPSSPSLLEDCRTHSYTTEIISLDPLMIYINNFTSPTEAEASSPCWHCLLPSPQSSQLIFRSSADFEDSFISRSGGGVQKVSGRTSQSAPLEISHPLVSCILGRARTFLGTMLQPTEPFSTPQLVRYFPTQRYDLHTDFWPRHQMLNDGSGRLFNRPASFFVFLRDNCTEGETYFPGVDVLERDRQGGLEGLFGGKVRKDGRRGKEGGVRFKPIVGNAIFWVNIGEDGVGDRRVVHAGLPVGEGEKIGMNIWPRKFYEAEE